MATKILLDKDNPCLLPCTIPQKVLLLANIRYHFGSCWTTEAGAPLPLGYIVRNRRGQDPLFLCPLFLAGDPSVGAIVFSFSSWEMATPIALPFHLLYG